MSAATKTLPVPIGSSVISVLGADEITDSEVAVIPPTLGSPTAPPLTLLAII
jgi:hypothetical protein